jgi:ABC-type Mn2+/Zn2+ transport system permease subunit
MNEIGWVFIYISAFGLSEYFVKKYLHEDIIVILYYSLIFSIGIWCLYKSNFNRYFKNLKFTQKED